MLILMKMCRGLAVLHLSELELLAQALDLVNNMLLFQNQQILHLLDLNLHSFLLFLLLVKLLILLLNFLVKIILLLHIAFVLLLRTFLLSLSPRRKVSLFFRDNL